MKTLTLTLAFILACAASVLSAPRDHIDPKSIKDKVSITLGTKGTIRFEQQGDTLTKPKINNNTDEKTPGIGVAFSKSDERMLMLKVQNRFAKALRYRAAMRLKGQKEFIETSLIPISAGLLSYEMWQDPIEELILFEFKLTDK